MQYVLLSVVSGMFAQPVERLAGHRHHGGGVDLFRVPSRRGARAVQHQQHPGFAFVLDGLHLCGSRRAADDSGFVSVFRRWRRSRHSIQSVGGGDHRIDHQRQRVYGGDFPGRHPGHRHRPDRSGAKSGPRLSDDHAESHFAAGHQNHDSGFSEPVHHYPQGYVHSVGHQRSRADPERPDHHRPQLSAVRSVLLCGAHVPGDHHGPVPAFAETGKEAEL